MKTITTTIAKGGLGIFVVLLGAAAASPAWGLSVSLTAPAKNAVFQAGATITVSANATPTNANRPITKVDFFVGGTTLIGTGTSSPYSISWTNVPAGSYSITAKATDSTGATATSVAVTIKVNAPPTVTLTAPANGAVFNPGSTIALTATASDSDGTVSKVDFLQGTTLLGTDTTSPYSFNWTNVATGAYTLTARATDSNSGVTTSTAVAITVDTPPTVSLTAPANNTVFLPGAAVTVTASAADTDGTVSKVDFFDGANLVATITSAPFTSNLTNLVAGTHSLTAKATDNLNQSTTSAAVSIRVDAAPTVSITSPANNAVFTPPASFTVTATATDTDGTVSKVDFFDGATLVGTVTAAPYNLALASVPSGTHPYTVRATDNNGAVTTSGVVSVVVNALPTIALTSPAVGASFNASATVQLSANASDTDGTVTRVDFYQGATLLGTSTAAPYGFSWANVAAGTYSVTAVATDDRGGGTTSAAVAIVVNALPIVSITSPANGAVLAAPATVTITANASDSDGTVAKVDFYQGATLIGTATTAPYSVSWSNVASGTYQLTAVASDNSGATTTSPAISVRVNAAPTVSLTTPTSGATFTARATVDITASAIDADGTISKVDFYRGGTLIISLTTPPYSFTWTEVPQGSYALTAVATDDLGASTTSDAVTITVNVGVAQIYYIHTDHLNTPRVIANSAGDVVWQWDQTESFGDAPANDNPSGLGAFEFNPRLRGQYFDREIGLHYNVFRDYSAALGRYVESDPLGLSAGPNTYGYALSDPLRRIDSLGLWSRQVHETIVNAAFPTLPEHLRQAIKDGSASVDDGPSQLGSAYPHAMRDPGQSVADAMKKYCKFIQDNVGDYTRNNNSASGILRNGAYRALGRALHSVMDSTSPVHVGFQEWRLSDAMKHGNMPESQEDIDSLTPDKLAETVDLINQLMSGANPCPCGR